MLLLRHTVRVSTRTSTGCTQCSQEYYYWDSQLPTGMWMHPGIEVARLVTCSRSQHWHLDVSLLSSTVRLLTVTPLHT